jgi:hypothetical protein
LIRISKLSDQIQQSNNPVDESFPACGELAYAKNINDHENQEMKLLNR